MNVRLNGSSLNCGCFISSGVRHLTVSFDLLQSGLSGPAGMVGIQKAVTQRSQCVCVCHLDHSVLPLKNLFCFLELYKTTLTKSVW